MVIPWRCKVRNTNIEISKGKIMTQSSKRIDSVDAGAGIMILWMIIYHAISFSLNIQLLEYEGALDVNSIPKNLHVLVGKNGQLIPKNACVIFPYLNFFMPWFFYKSGQFFVKREMRELWKKDVSKLLTPFLIWSLIGYVMYLLFHAITHTLTWENSTIHIASALFKSGSIPLNLPLWFLTTLFGVRLVANLCITTNNTYTGWLRLIAIIVLGYTIAFLAHVLHNKFLPEWVANSASGLVFFAMGYGLKEHEHKTWLFLPCLQVYLICVFVGFPIVDMHSNSLLAGCFWAWIPVAICSIVAFNNVCAIICKFFRLTVLLWIGRHSMQIFISHFLILYTIDFVIRYFELVQLRPYSLWLMIGAYTLILPICCMCINSSGRIRIAMCRDE